MYFIFNSLLFCFFVKVRLNVAMCIWGDITATAQTIGLIVLRQGLFGLNDAE